MARKRSKKNNDVEIAKLIVFAVLVALFLYTKNIQATFQLGLIILIMGLALYALVVYLIKRHRKHKQSLSYDNILTSSAHDQALATSKAGTGFNKSSGHTPSKHSYRHKIYSEELIDSAYPGKILGLESSPANAPIQPKPEEWSIDLIRSLDWKCFEVLCAEFFLAKGQEAKVTSIGADGGIDVLLYGKSNPEKILGVVQCKAWSQKPVGVKEMRELFGIMADKGCRLGVYMTTSDYTPDAKKFAEGKHINLINAEQLLAQLLKLPEAIQKELLEKITAGDYTTPSCPNCDIKLILRTTKKGTQAGKNFWGCRNYPKCRYTMRQAKQ